MEHNTRQNPQLNLVKRDFLHREKRVFPRFSPGALTFKCVAPIINKIFQITDLSATGMQLSLRAIEEEELKKHPIERDTEISGIIHWGRDIVPVSGIVRWREGLCFGVRFAMENTKQEGFAEFFSLERMVKKMRPLHDPKVGPGPETELPVGLKYWFKSDGTLELFMWKHDDGSHSKVQLILLDDYVEWEDGRGLMTGKKIGSETRELETPLQEKEELVIEFDDSADDKKLDRAEHFFNFLTIDHLPEIELQFLKAKFHS